jgi:lipopolysaccharide biosynthesis glycosyltransferase
MKFVTITDDNQWRYSLVNIFALYALKLKYTFYIYTTTQYAKECILDTLSKFPQLFNFFGQVHVNVIPSFQETFNIEVANTNHEWISIATLDRLVVPTLEQHKNDRLVWLDVDTLIFNSDIANLFTSNTKTSNKGIAAVPTETLLHKHILNFSNTPNLLSLTNANRSTFNAGVCVYDIDKFNIQEYTQLIQDIFERNNGEYTNDEIILNLYDQEYQSIPGRYNCQPYIKYTPLQQSIIHFTGAEYKPWNKNIYTSGVYLKYYKLWEYYFACLFS